MLCPSKNNESEELEPMESLLDYKGDRGLRMLDIFERLNRGEVLNKRELAKAYGVGEKTIQRDFDGIRNYLADRQASRPDATVQYDRAANAYRLSRFEREWLTNQEALALCKILLESRALPKTEMTQLIDKNNRAVVLGNCTCSMESVFSHQPSS